MQGICVFWFRRDLRLEDNVGLSKALESGLPVLPVFIFDPQILSELPIDDARVNFIHDSLMAINKQLATFGSSLYTVYKEPSLAWKQILDEFEVKEVFFNKDYEPYARKRDSEVASLLGSNQIKVNSFKDQVIFEENEVVKNDGLPYTVFTPFKRKWLECLGETVVAKNSSSNYVKRNFKLPTLEELGFKPSNIVVPKFDIEVVGNYDKTRDLPLLNTSKVGPHLRFGTIGIRTILDKVKNLNSIYVSELIWREFFMQILFHFPKVVKENFHAKYNGIKWLNNEADLEKWKKGKTGYPLVDAGMRELNATGFMHNRVRMVTASFLCKHLLIDWRIGEAYFADKLLDYELASNNGNWQWAAGTGCDAAPYFRVFNPYTQAQKFDPQNKYISKWIPELGKEGYPLEVVEHKYARERALATYKKALSK